MSLEDVSAETETSIEEDDKFAELSRSELEEFVAILSLLLDTLVSLSLDPSTSLRVTFCGVTGPELLESEEHAKKTALAAVTITRGAASFWSIL